MIQPTIEVFLSVSVDENGIVDCCVHDTNQITQKIKYQKWIDEKRKSPTLVSVKTFKVSVPLPVSFEEID